VIVTVTLVPIAAALGEIMVTVGTGGSTVNAFDRGADIPPGAVTVTLCGPSEAVAESTKFTVSDVALVTFTF
jgi:hypothetical protein